MHIAPEIYPIVIVMLFGLALMFAEPAEQDLDAEAEFDDHADTRW